MTGFQHEPLIESLSAQNDHTVPFYQKISILKQEWTTEKISYERRVYESEDDRRLSWVISQKSTVSKINSLKC